MSEIEMKLAAMGLTLPQVSTPVAAYIPAVRTGRFLYTSGQVPLIDGHLPYTGKVGAEVTFEQAKEMARVCALNALAVVNSVAGDLDRVQRIVKLVGYVASAPDFTGQHQIINGASELLAEVLGARGQHARSAVGVAVLPMDAPVEVELQVELRSIEHD